MFGVYLASYGLLSGITGLLGLLGPAGGELAANLWGIAFIFGLLTALAARALAERLGLAHLLDGGGLTRVAGGAVDFMIAAGLASIAVGVIAEYWLVLAVFALLIGTLTLTSLMWITPRMFADHSFARLLMFYGSLTGTLTTGIALVRVVDPELRTPAAADYCYASGLTFFLAIPMILVLNVPANGGGAWVPAAVLAAYALAIAAAFRALIGKEGLAAARFGLERPIRENAPGGVTGQPWGCLLSYLHEGHLAFRPLGFSPPLPRGLFLSSALFCSVRCPVPCAVLFRALSSPEVQEAQPLTRSGISSGVGGDARARGTEGVDLVAGRPLGPFHQRAGVAHGLAFRGHPSGDEGHHRLGHLAPDVVGGALLVGAADLPDQHHPVGAGVALEQLQHVDEVGAVHGVAADADAGGLADAALGQGRTPPRR